MTKAMYEVDEEALREFIEYRNTETKKPIGEIAIRRARAKLSQWPPEFQRMSVDESIINGWVGLFPPKVAGSVTKGDNRQDAEGRYVNPRNTMEESHNAFIDARAGRASGPVVEPDDAGELWGTAHREAEDRRRRKRLEQSVVPLPRRKK